MCEGVESCTLWEMAEQSAFLMSALLHWPSMLLLLLHSSFNLLLSSQARHPLWSGWHGILPYITAWPAWCCSAVAAR